jgi:6-pyruvoyl-tetrahydropterin synthase
MIIYFQSIAHWIARKTCSAFEGYRERLHGHNYKVGVRVLGSRKIAGDGYVVDFGNIKAVTRKICKELNESFLCPMLSDVIDIAINESPVNGSETVTLKCQDGSTFVFPKGDCALLPIVHATTEELAIFLWSRILNGLSAPYLLQRGVHTLEVIVNEAIGQEAVFRLEIPKGDFEKSILDVRAFIMEGKVTPMPCQLPPSETKACSKETCGCCASNLSKSLETLARALKQRSTKNDGCSDITANDLMEMLG